MTDDITANFRYILPIQLRFADLDALGHLNNAKYVTYMEHIRIEYVREVCGWRGNWEEFGMILARTEIDYLQPIFFEDTVSIAMRISRMGNKSFDAEYLIMRQATPESERLIAAQAKTVLVAYDYGAQKTVPLADAWRQSILNYEPAL